MIPYEQLFIQLKSSEKTSTMTSKSTLRKITHIIQKNIEKALIHKSNLVHDISVLENTLKHIKEAFDAELNKVTAIIIDDNMNANLNVNITCYYDFASFSKKELDKQNNIKADMLKLQKQVDDLTQEISQLNTEKKQYEFLLEQVIANEIKEAEKREMKEMDEFTRIVYKTPHI